MTRATYSLEQIAPQRVSRDGQIWIICRTDANATAGAGFDPADPATHAVGRQGNEVANRPIANKPVAAKAKISRRNSLRKQRDALKN
jgi:hypothetical protein